MTTNQAHDPLPKLGGGFFMLFVVLFVEEGLVAPAAERLFKMQCSLRVCMLP